MVNIQILIDTLRNYFLQIDILHNQENKFISRIQKYSRYIKLNIDFRKFVECFSNKPIVITKFSFLLFKTLFKNSTGRDKNNASDV